MVVVPTYAGNHCIVTVKTLSDRVKKMILVFESSLILIEYLLE